MRIIRRNKLGIIWRGSLYIKRAVGTILLRGVAFSLAEERPVIQPYM